MTDKTTVTTAGGKVYKIEKEFTGIHYVYRNGLVGKTKNMTEALTLIEHDSGEKIKSIS